MGGAFNAPILCKDISLFLETEGLFCFPDGQCTEKGCFWKKQVPGEGSNPLSVSKRHSTKRPTIFGLAPDGSRRLISSGRSTLRVNTHHRSCPAVSFLRPCHASQHTGLPRPPMFQADSRLGEGSFLSNSPLKARFRWPFTSSWRHLSERRHYKNLATIGIALELYCLLNMFSPEYRDLQVCG